MRDVYVCYVAEGGPGEPLHWRGGAKRAESTGWDDAVVGVQFVV
jgi:hypothetical protein